MATKKVKSTESQNSLILKYCDRRIKYLEQKGDKISDIQLGMRDAYAGIIDRFSK